MLLPDHSLVEPPVHPTRLRCITGRVDCCTNTGTSHNPNIAITKWYLPGDVAATSGFASYGSGASLGAIELATGSPEASMQGIHRCTLPEPDPATNPSPISLYIGIYTPGQGEVNYVGGENMRKEYYWERNVYNSST